MQIREFVDGDYYLPLELTGKFLEESEKIIKFRLFEQGIIQDLSHL